MSTVTLVSGGIDSTLLCFLIQQSGGVQHPLLINYGQSSFSSDAYSCRQEFSRLNLPAPKIVELQGYGHAFGGKQNSNWFEDEDQFVPGRNQLLLLCAAAHAVTVDANCIAIGMHDKALCKYPDQRESFVIAASKVLRESFGRPFEIISPFLSLRQADVLAMANEFKIFRN
jgi:7-cyano-7-deazaguanine synthase